MKVLLTKSLRGEDNSSHSDGMKEERLNIENLSVMEMEIVPQV